MASHVFDLIAQEELRQETTVELIASENFASGNVLRAVGSCLTNKYSEGYPAHRAMGNQGRYYGGCHVVDELEEYCIAKWKEVFATDYHVNVQPHSGSSANLAAYMALLQPGDTVLSMSLANGGHLTHGSPVNFSGKLYDLHFYDVDGDGFIDYDAMERTTIAFPPHSMKPLGMVSVMWPKRLPKPAAMMTAVLIIVMGGNLNVVLHQSLLENHKEVLDILHVDGAERAETEGVGG